MLYRFSLFVAAATFLLILAGGLVTSHEAGLSVPDWPASYGRWFPPMVGNIFWEHGHRMIAAIVGILTILLALLIQGYEKRGWLKKLAWTAVSLMLVQAALGGLTVRYLLPAPISIAHACLAQTFFCVTIALAYFLRAPASLPTPKGETRLGRLALITASVIYLQLILGATVRHTAHGIIPHVVAAFLVAIHVLLLLLRILRTGEMQPGLTTPGLALGGVTLVQIFLGVGAFICTRMIPRGYAPSPGEIFFTVAHQTTGALVLGLGVLIALMVRR